MEQVFWVELLSLALVFELLHELEVWVEQLELVLALVPSLAPAWELASLLAVCVMLLCGFEVEAARNSS